VDAHHDGPQVALLRRGHRLDKETENVRGVGHRRWQHGTGIGALIHPGERRAYLLMRRHQLGIHLITPRAAGGPVKQTQRRRPGGSRNPGVQGPADQFHDITAGRPPPVTYLRVLLGLGAASPLPRLLLPMRRPGAFRLMGPTPGVLTRADAYLGPPLMDPRVALGFSSTNVILALPYPFGSQCAVASEDLTLCAKQRVATRPEQRTCLLSASFRPCDRGPGVTDPLGQLLLAEISGCTPCLQCPAQRPAQRVDHLAVIPRQCFDPSCYVDRPDAGDRSGR
jgi:hypothetical protein